MLSAERKKSLADHYEVWGVEEVRDELDRPDRDQFVDSEVMAFAQSWIEAKEAKARRRATYSMLFAAIGLILLGVDVAGVLTYAS